MVNQPSAEAPQGARFRLAATEEYRRKIPAQTLRTLTGQNVPTLPAHHPDCQSADAGRRLVATTRHHRQDRRRPRSRTEGAADALANISLGVCMHAS
jgi:hypothetical protein